MKKIIFLVSVLFITLGYSSNSYSVEKNTKKTTELKSVKSGDIIKGSLIIRFKESTPKNYIKEIEKKLKVKSDVISKDLSIYKIKLTSNQSQNKIVSDLSKDKYIKYVENDRVMKIQKKNNSMGIMGINEKNENK